MSRSYWNRTKINRHVMWPLPRGCTAFSGCRTESRESWGALRAQTRSTSSLNTEKKTNVWLLCYFIHTHTHTRAYTRIYIHIYITCYYNSKEEITTPDVLLWRCEITHQNVCLVHKNIFLFLLGDKDHFVEEEHMSKALRAPHSERSLRCQFAVSSKIFKLLENNRTLIIA